MDRSEIDVIRQSGLFDETWYRRRYSDVAGAGLDPVEHYLRVGADMGRDPSPAFDTRGYLAKNHDVRAAGVNPLVHFIRIGRAEGRDPLPRETRPQPVADDAVPGGDPSPEPHYGPGLRAFEEIGAARGEPYGASEEYDSVRKAMDVPFYLGKNRDVARAYPLDPVRHYIESCARGEEREPSPHFSTKRYLERYPEVRESGLNPLHHWVTVGRGKHYLGAAFQDFEGLCRVLGRDPWDMQEHLSAVRDDIRARLDHGTLGEMVEKAAGLDPLIAHTWPDSFDVKLPPFHTDMFVTRTVAMYRAQEQAGFRRARIVLAFNRPRWGGARRMEGHIAHALADLYGAGEIIAMSTDHGGEVMPGKFPDGCRYVDLASEVEGLAPEMRQRVLIEFLRSVRADAVFNINSRLLWDALGPYGKALAKSTRTYACMFCNEQTPFGYWTGYPIRQFYRGFDVLAGVCTDSHALADWFRTQYCVPPAWNDRLTVLEAPVDTAIPVAPVPEPAEGRRPQVFWSGRFDRQKRVDVVYALARRMPHVDFRMWGEPVLDRTSERLEKPENVRHEGVYAAFSDLPLQDCDLWLYTSEWDGVPSILLELSMTGVPIVGSLAGGTGEILQPDLAWPIAPVDDVEAYRAAIEAVLADPDAARARSLRLREAMAGRRTQAAYREALRRLLEGGEA